MRFRIWKSWDEEERAAAVRIAGLCVAALTLFIFISTFSYLFHWREDMSLLGDPAAMDASRAVGNVAGKLGFRTGHLLVCDLFGLGSFSLLIILAGCFWGSMGLFVRKLSADGFDPIQIVSIRVTLAALFFCIILFVKDRSGFKISFRDIPLFLGLGFGSILFFTVCYFMELRKRDAKTFFFPLVICVVNIFL